MKRKEFQEQEFYPEKKEKKMIDYSGKTFVIHDKVSQKVQDFIQERGGKFYEGKIEYSKVNRSQTFFLVEKEDFLSFYFSVEHCHMYTFISPDYISDEIDLTNGRNYQRLRIPSLGIGSGYKIISKDKEKVEKLEKLITKYGGMIVDYKQKRDFSLVCSKEDIKMEKDFYKTNLADVQLVFDLEKTLKYLEEFDISKTSETIGGLTVENLWGMDLSEFDDFQIYNNRRESRSMDCVVPQKRDKNQMICNIPMDILKIILSYLPIKDHINTRLLCKELSYYDNDYWSYICNISLKENLWIPQIPIEKVNYENKSWFRFFRESINPLLTDKKVIEKFFIKQKVDLTIFKDHESKIYKPGVYVDTKRSKKDVEIGKSKFGGSPHFPPKMKWPKNQSFIAQINLSDLTPFFSFQNLALPRKGILYFFCETADAMDEGCVLFYDGDVSNLSPMEIPEWMEDSENQVYPVCETKFYEAISQVKSTDLQNLGVNNDIDHSNHLPSSSKNGHLYHCLFGNEEPVQGDAVQNGSFLLFQICSDKNLDALFGDCGMLYYTMKFDDLKNIKKDPSGWKNVNFEMQCS